MTQDHNPYIRPDDGALMRRYLNWARPYYDRYPDGRRDQLVAIDRWLYSSKSIGPVMGVLGSFGGTVVGLHFAGAAWALAIALALIIYMVCGFVGVRTWIGPDLAAEFGKRPVTGWRRNPWAFAIFFPVMGYAGAQFGFVIGRATRYPEQISFAQVFDWFIQSLVETTPFSVALLGLVLGIVGITLFIKQHRLTIQVERLRLQAQIDAHAALATQAQLKVLQAQIKPHFLFNTLAALQHWTDTQDPRASAMLRSLTSFLRRSTDAMDLPLVELQLELDLVRDYLTIMQHRLGSKLQFSVVAQPGAALLTVPPALVLSLVENAVEHGIEPSLAGGEVSVLASVNNENLCIRVNDTGRGAQTVTEGTGLTNTRNRLKAHFGDRASLEIEANPGAGFAAAVRISASVM